VGRKAEHLALLRPFGRQVGETGNAHAVRKAIADQIAELNASKPNEPDRLVQQNDFVAFLQTIAAGLDDQGRVLINRA
jgi:hypothetical protein